jgi:hypothetical protein
VPPAPAAATLPAATPDVQGAAAATADAAASVQQPAAAADAGDAGSGKRRVPLQKWVQCADCNKWRQVSAGLICICSEPWRLVTLPACLLTAAVLHAWFRIQQRHIVLQQ